jgi:CubicO group peptidase (beta-lactamase class C family)
MREKHVHGFRRVGFALALVVCLLLSVCSVSPPVQAAPTHATGQPACAAILEPLLLAKMQQLHILGALVSVDPPAQCSWTTTLGRADLTTDAPPDLHGYYRIGSITKTLVATVVLQLAEGGQLGLDDPIGRYFPQVPNGSTITIREVLNMTSGLFDYSSDDGFVQALLANPHKVWDPGDLLAIAFKHPPYFAPGQDIHYSNTDYILLGLLIEQITHRPVEEVLQQRIFAPLHMDHTSLPPRSSEALPSPHPEGYFFLTPTVPTDVTNWNPSWGWTAGSAISTLDDLKIWAKALATGTLLSAAMQRQRLTFVPFSLNGQPLFWLGHRVGYGLGIIDFASMIGHAGDLPGFSSFVGYDPQKAATIVVLANNYNASGNIDASMLEMVIQKELFA